MSKPDPDYAQERAPDDDIALTGKLARIALAIIGAAVLCSLW